MLSESMVIEPVVRKFRVLYVLRKVQSYFHHTLIGHQFLRILEGTVAWNTG